MLNNIKRIIRRHDKKELAAVSSRLVNLEHVCLKKQSFRPDKQGVDRKENTVNKTGDLGCTMEHINKGNDNAHAYRALNKNASKLRKPATSEHISVPVMSQSDRQVRSQENIQHPILIECIVDSEYLTVS